jgi:hypothetical protein
MPLAWHKTRCRSGPWARRGVRRCSALRFAGYNMYLRPTKYHVGLCICEQYITHQTLDWNTICFGKRHTGYSGCSECCVLSPISSVCTVSDACINSCPDFDVSILGLGKRQTGYSGFSECCVLSLISSVSDACINPWISFDVSIVGLGKRQTVLGVGSALHLQWSPYLTSCMLMYR